MENAGEIPLEEKLQHLIQEGVIFHQHGQLQQAAQAYQKALNLLSFSLGSLEELPQSAQTVQSHHTTYISKSLHLLGLVRFQEGKLEQSEELIAHAIQLDPTKACSNRETIPRSVNRYTPRF